MIKTALFFENKLEKVKWNDILQQTNPACFMFELKTNDDVIVKQRLLPQGDCYP